MRSLLGSLTSRPRNEAAVPLVGRSSVGRFGGLFGSRNDAVSQMSAMATTGILFSIVNRTSNATAAVDWHLYRKAKSGKKEDRVEVTSHAALDLWNRPNPFMPQQEFVESSQQHIDLTGESYWVITRHPRFKVPLEMWPIRPDRITPDPHPTKFLVGYNYSSPDGEIIPLGLDEVIQLRMPHPLDLYRGLGPVQALLTDLDTVRYSAEWNRNFFMNSAEPGGIIEVEKRLSDPEFDEMSDRWDEQHKGVANAHRVAIIEQGKWVNRTFTMKDMQFAELRKLGRDTVMEAFGISKTALGISDDVNRAAATAAKALFAEDLTVPRVERHKGALNHNYLPLFGDTATDLEFDYDSPVPADEEATNAERNSKAESAQKYIAAGFTGDSVAVALDAPAGMVWEKPATPAQLPPQLPVPPVEPSTNRVTLKIGSSPDSADQLLAMLRKTLGIRNAPPLEPPTDGWPEYDLDAVNAIDLGPVQAAWESALSALLEQWKTSVVAEWIAQLIAAIKAAISGNQGDLAGLTIDASPAVTILADAMAELAEISAGHVVDEAADQDVTLTAEWPTADDLSGAATQIVEFEAQRYALTAGREAARIAWPDADPDAVAEQVETYLAELSDAGIEQALGGALTNAQNQARASTLRSGPVGAIYASEQMDSATCAPCKEIHGRWICNTDDQEAVYALYPTGGYIDCKGRWRCRGTVTGVWRPQTTEGGQ
jgi:HK97 family phage portal protein